MDVLTRRELDSAFRNLILPATIDDVDQFLESCFILMTPKWDETQDCLKAPSSEKPARMEKN